ncbi:hypothetical protein [Leptolyngbya sp. 'hensonii']|uniref:hypothetical protein n=1 Tax=Leptolyngbya sp. 'hensonii' TaxID=1922337 RepID=UPI0009F948A7|nr:hypothetical protein [Leptolyngbya sp. 'hensonii']
MAIDVTTFSKSLTYTAAIPIAAILQDLQQIAALDQVAEVQQKKFNWLLGISVVVAIMSCFLLATGVGFILLPLSVSAAIYSGVQAAKYSRLNVDNARYELLKRLLQMLGRDLQTGSEIETVLILSSPTDKSKKTTTVAHRYRSGWKVDLFEDPWLKLRGRFADGTRFCMTATELGQTAYGWKRGRSGKNKYKSKTKSKGTELAVTLTYSQRKYGAVKVLQDSWQNAIKLPAGVRLKRVRLTDKGMLLQVTAPPDMTPARDNLYKTVTMMFLSLYQVLNLARVLSKPKQA